jgi:arylsulfatase A-like enzyme
LIAGSLTNLMQGFDKQFYTYKAPYTKPASEMTRAKLLPGDRSTEISPGFRSADPDSGWDKAVYKDAAPLISAEFLRWLDERESKKKPFFAYLNFMEAHTPRVPSQAARERVMTPAQQQLALETDASLFTEMAWMVGKREYSSEQIDAMRGVYDAALVDLDDATHALMEGLRERGVLEDTVVVLLADHGESLGEHRLFEHRYTVYQTLLHVPLVIRYPKAVAAGRIDRPVSTMDLFATLLKLTKQEVPAGCERSVDLFAPERPSVVHSTLRDPYLASLSDVAKAYPDLDLAPWKRTFDAVIADNYKLIVGSDGKAELFDLVKDPGETTDLLTVESKVVEDLKQQLAAWEAGLCPYEASKRTAEESKKVSGRRTPEEREMLELLGYAEGEEPAEEAPAPAPAKGGKGRPRRP